MKNQDRSNFSVKASFKIFSDEVRVYTDKILEACNTNDQIAELYGGCQLLYSDIIYSPDVLFIGYNPGTGYYSKEGSRVNKLEPADKLEYLDNAEYQLSRQTNVVFSDANKSDLLRNSMKTNYFYISTDDVKQFRELSIILKNKLDIDIWSLAKKWTSTLISMVKPRTVICEGKETFGLVLSSIDTGRTVTPVWINDCVVIKFNDVRIIGYKRRRSIIINKSELCSLLKSHL